MSGAPDRPLRVCLVGPSLDILGGQAVQLDRLLQRLQGVPGLEAEFLPVNPRLPGPFRLLQRVKFVRTVVTSLAYVVSLVRRLRRVDVVHAFSASYWSFVLAPLPAMLIGRAFGKGVILNYHSGHADDHLTRWKRSAVPAMRLAQEIIVPSGYLVDVFARHGLTASAIVNFLDAERFLWRDRTTPRPLFLSNRNLEPLYNVACTLRAFARIQAELPEAQLTVLGDGSERGRLEELARSLGLRNVVFAGLIAPDEMPARYAAADVFLNSPNIDNMPLSIIESFAAGLPVATTDAGGIPYILRHGVTGLMVPRDDDAALAREALRLVREPGLAARLAAAARDECLTKYVWPAVRGEWERVYRSVHARAHGEPLVAASEARA